MLKVCGNCGKELTKRKRKWCSKVCLEQYRYRHGGKEKRTIQRYKKDFKDLKKNLIKDFFEHYSENDGWKEEGIEKMAELFSKTACRVTKKQQCELEEAILIKAGKLNKKELKSKLELFALNEDDFNVI